MRTLRFVVDAQKISPDPSCDFSGIVPGTAGYLKSHFSFSAEWSGMVKVAEFRKYACDSPIPIPIVHWECILPEEVTDGKSWLVKVIGKKGDVILPTGNCKVEQEG